MRSSAVRSNLLVSEVREVMDIRQASEYLGISSDTLYKYASEGFVPAFKLGNRWRFKRSRMDEWMDRQSDLHAADAEAGAACVLKGRGPLASSAAQFRDKGAEYLWRT
jgi:excisionase family DNA binding protein